MNFKDMKKYLLIFISTLLFVYTSLAQQAGTPTKEQTMDWIAGKLQQYIRDPKKRVFKSYSNGIFVYERRLYDCDGRLLQINTCTIDLNKITSYHFYPYTWEAEFSGNNLVTLNLRNQVSGRSGTTYSNNIKVAGNDDQNCDPDSWAGDTHHYTSFNFDLEAGLLDRMSKALDALIQYNTRKPGEIW